MRLSEWIELVLLVTHDPQVLHLVLVTVVLVPANTSVAVLKAELAPTSIFAISILQLSNSGHLWRYQGIENHFCSLSW